MTEGAMKAAMSARARREWNEMKGKEKDWKEERETQWKKWNGKNEWKKNEWIDMYWKESEMNWHEINTWTNEWMNEWLHETTWKWNELQAWMNQCMNEMKWKDMKWWDDLFLMHEIVHESPLWTAFPLICVQDSLQIRLPQCHDLFMPAGEELTQAMKFGIRCHAAAKVRVWIHGRPKRRHFWTNEWNEWMNGRMTEASN